MAILTRTTAFGNLAFPSCCRKRLLERINGRQRAHQTLRRCVSSNEASNDVDILELSVDFSEVDVIEVENPDVMSSIREATDELDDTLGFTTSEDEGDGVEEDRWAGVWLLGLCTISYLHCCSTGFSIPALLPSIAGDTSLTDFQASFLTVGFTLMYAAGQIPFGYLADQTERPKLLASGIVVWSLVTTVCSKATSFSDLLLVRLTTAASQSMQNPISFGLIPELFPNRRTTALSIYNCALYFGRGVSYVLALILAKFGVSGLMGLQTVQLENFDVTTMSLLYITGDQATVVPVFDYDFRMLAEKASSWRDLLVWIGLPGLGVAFLLALAPDPRRARKKKKKAERGLVAQTEKKPDAWQTIKQIVGDRGFQATTFAAATNDVGFWSLISWQALYYERIFHIDSSVYAPFLAAIIPTSGIIGGVGGSMLADWLTTKNKRYLLTFGATVIGAPLIFISLEAGDYSTSFRYLFLGCSFLECWRASSAIMIRESAPPGAASTAAAVHLFARTLVASAGPLLIATLQPLVGLRQAMTVVPLSYLISGILFGLAEKIVFERKKDDPAHAIGDSSI